ncbi:MAG TPA: hypothetical protein VM451_01405 [Candidatus Limnocylindria bacterium]|nr:hypothetical protein [Candidatus Limnocylindria bacterium]
MSEWWEVPGGATAGDDVTATPPDPGDDAAVGASGSKTDTDARTCPWCAAPAAGGATRCSSCGAALAQRESIADLVIPGLTTVDPALKDYAARPMQLRGPSPSQGLASGAIVAAAAGGPAGIAALAGIGAVAAVEYFGASAGKVQAANVGETSEAVRLALERLERGEQLPTAADETPRPELDAPARTRDHPPAMVADVEEEGSDGRG